MDFFKFLEFWIFGPVFGHFFILKSHKAYETSHKNYAAKFLKGIFIILLLNMVTLLLTFENLSAKPKNLISLMSQKRVKIFRHYILLQKCLEAVNSHLK
jgi:hypothetical protein